MDDVNDVAAALIEEHGPMDPVKLQKLLYYTQLTDLASRDEPLFEAEIQAWRHGPVVREIYDGHARSSDKMDNWAGGNSARLSPVGWDVVRRVVDIYGSYSGWDLADMSHAESPWLEARPGLKDGQSSSARISIEAMRRYARWTKRTAEEAVVDAVANQRLEGGDLAIDDPDLLDVASGRRQADAVIHDILSKYPRCA
ncbi:type II toxin-antitoxin system antitoxin SocA domain-containing protein [Kocuria sp.]|uniref:Panacea domain-containing protein n=1 Tax=Kocuria sp. TaxID=1871328 RepID=UPI00289743D1|nr:type II toxin-antitoxin system antitoxin SocA domain-containing protein [Kocuria sp.]